MSIIKTLIDRWDQVDSPFLIHHKGQLHFNQLLNLHDLDLSEIESGDVVALIGDYDPVSIRSLLHLIDMNVVIVPLTLDTINDHEYFFDAAKVSVILQNGSVTRIRAQRRDKLIDKLRIQNHGGLVLFSTGTTGKPKAILHDLTLFLKRFETPRPAMNAINFLLFDHIGGLNTLLHTLFNTGTVIAPKSRSVEDVLAVCSEHEIEVLPTTPTFLRMMLMSGLVPSEIPETLKIITYGTERMDQPTLNELCCLLPNVDFRQTFGMSELGILRVKSEARNSLYMKIGGEGVETRIVEGVLEIRSENRMLGYLNSEQPFDDEGWYNTKDLVKQRGEYIKVIGRTNEVINVGGLKFMASDVERVILNYPDITLVKAIGKPNPISGQHVEIKIKIKDGSTFSTTHFKEFLKNNLPSHMHPMRIKINDVAVSHRYKRL